MARASEISMFERIASLDYMMDESSIMRALRLAMIPILTLTPAWASSICATVTVHENYPLPRVQVKVVSMLEPSIHFAATTDDRGTACVDHLPEGTYSVEASRGGFVNSMYYPVRVLFPRNKSLYFRLPIGEVTEGPILQEVELSGTLAEAGGAAEGVKICLFDPGGGNPVVCTVTNDLGQYAIKLAPRIYRLELTRQQQKLDGRTIDLSVPGFYHDKLKIPER